MTEVVLINAFVVPPTLSNEYMSKYHTVMEGMSRQPGFLGGGLHRATDPDGARF